MVTSAIALRFRDTTPGIDTINAHRQIIDTEGSVWWGWWKKDFEDAQAEFFNSVGEEICLYIVDRSTSRMFTAHSVERAISPSSTPELSRVPEYYRHSAKRVYGWFLITSINEVPYDSEIGNRFGDGTLVVLGSATAAPSVNGVQVSKKEIQKSSILVLSDLHFGADYGFLLQNETPTVGGTKNKLADCIMEDLTRLGLETDIGAILVTGDFTSNGTWTDNVIKQIVAEFTVIRGKLGVEKSNIFALPGNHDVVRYPEGQEVDVARLAVDSQVTFEHERNFRFFLFELLGRSIDEPLDRVELISLKDADIRIGILNSCRILATNWTEYGYVGPSGFSVIEKLAGGQPSRATYRMIAVHHHLLPVNSVEAPNKKGVTLSLDASKLLEAAQKAGVQIAVHGHQHMPHLSRYQSIPLMGAEEMPAITVVSNGSSGVSVNRLPGAERNTYCILTFSADEVKLTMRELRSDMKEGNSLYQGTVCFSQK